jgi:hypothetical protein
MTGGIYKIYFSDNPNRFYIGRSINIDRRIKSHKYLLDKNKHHSPKLQNEYNKNKNIVFEVAHNIHDVNNQKLKEQSYINKGCYYNVSNNSKGGRGSSPIHKLKRLKGNAYVNYFKELLDDGNKHAVKYYFKLMYGDPKKMTDSNRIDLINKLSKINY